MRLSGLPWECQGFLAGKQTKIGISRHLEPFKGARRIALWERLPRPQRHRHPRDGQTMKGPFLWSLRDYPTHVSNGMRRGGGSKLRYCRLGQCTVYIYFLKCTRDPPPPLLLFCYITTVDKNLGTIGTADRLCLTRKCKKFRYGDREENSEWAGRPVS